ncbi:uncharacterized protein A4U43_C04F23370 [Asparagus officinalis]|uniref:Dolichol phosphate-mannose biosynthesis regulatory protein n=1 Tax=Asparagus officinalis TaxID=4686 RepID=A0A5P1F8G3_ASPOF|nr:uncharacterized protein A4U43_C04F23370 [Asparagus officinalis]
MSSTSGQQQFRYTQTPSKVLHLRNLPWECTDEELVELCKPFGKIVNTKCNVGENRNQAFVEFSDLNQAISMVSYCASSSEPAQVRGKTVYIQYSNRQEIVNNKSTGDIAGNVLLITIEGVEAGDVSIDVIHLNLVKKYPSISMELADKEVGLLLTSISISLFTYYTFWVIILPFVDQDHFIHSIPGYYEAFWKELDGVKQIWKNRKELK